MFISPYNAGSRDIFPSLCWGDCVESENIRTVMVGNSMTEKFEKKKCLMLNGNKCHCFIHCELKIRFFNNTRTIRKMKFCCLFWYSGHCEVIWTFWCIRLKSGREMDAELNADCDYYYIWCQFKIIFLTKLFHINKRLASLGTWSHTVSHDVWILLLWWTPHDQFSGEQGGEFGPDLRQSGSKH